MILGFTGSRGHAPFYRMPPSQLFALKDWLKEQQPEEVHHGDCLGADAEFHDAVVAGVAGCCRIVIHPPLDGKQRAFCSTLDVRVETVYPARFLDRNHDIVRASERLLACPRDKEALRSGTWATVRYARKLGKAITIISADGEVTDE